MTSEPREPSKDPADAGSHKYWAFISYSSKDTLAARRLHVRLETYRIPKELVGRPGRDENVPRRLFPIFRDRDELPLSHDLGATIQDALRASKYLIVLCSPHAAQSKWVNEEVRYFKSLGRADRILAVIVSGVPNASDDSGTAHLECFPPALRYRVDAQGQMTDERTEPIGGDLRRGGDGWTSVVLKAVAGITGVGYDAFAKREAKRARRQRVAYVVLACLCLCAGLWFWDYKRLKVHYYGQTAERWGVPYGVSPISAKQQRARGSTYRLESRGYKVRRVEQINGSGGLIEEDANGAARTDVFYREDGSLDRIMLYDRNGKLVTQKSYSKKGTANAEGLFPLTISFLSKSEFAQTLKADSTALTAPSALQSDAKRADITAYQAYFDIAGRLKSIFFRNAYGSPVADPNGVYGQAFQYDDQGLVVETTNLDANGTPMRDRRGVQAVRRAYGSFSTLTRRAYLDTNGRPILGPDHVAIFTYALDAVGNQVEKACFDEEEHPTFHQEGYHRQIWEFDEAGNTIAGYLFDTVGKPCLHRDGFAGSRFEWDANGYLSAGTYLGVDGQPVLGKIGVCRARTINDARGNMTETVLLDTRGDPTMSANGWSKIIRRFDAQGNLGETSIFDAAGQPTLAKTGVWRNVYLYDDHGNQVEAANYGLDGSLCTNAEGVAIERTLYDELNNAIEVQYFGPDGQPTIHKSGMAKKTMVYDEHGNVIETSFWGMAGEPIQAADGFAKSTQRFDTRGNLVEIQNFDKTGLPVLNKQGFARQVRTFDENGWEIRRDFFGTDGRPVIAERGGARIEIKRDRYGNELENSLFDRNYMPIANAQDVHRMVTEIDDRGNHISMRYYGPTGAPVPHKEYKVAEIRMKYNARNRETDIEYFNESRQPVLGGRLLCAKRSREYDERGNIIEERTYGVDGKPRLDVDGHARLEVQYDDHNNPIVQKYYGIDDQPTEIFKGMARTEMKYDAMSRQVEQTHFDLKGQLAEDDEGVARVTQKHDARGNIIEQCYYGKDGKPTNGTNGTARVEMQYDVAGNITEHKFFGTDGRPKLGPNGIARYVATYDSRGEVLTLKSYGVDGKPCVASFGSASIEKRYDRQGRLTEEISLGPDGRPMRAKGKYARLTIQYDEMGNPKEQCYFDENGQPVEAFEGSARATYQYDALGNPTELSCFGTDGKLVINQRGYARTVIQRDERGRVLQQAYYGTHDNLIVSSSGYAIIRNRYDEQGRGIETAHFGPDEKPIAVDGIARATAAHNERGQVTEMLRFGADGSRLVHPDLGYVERASYHANGTTARYEALQLHPDRLPDNPAIENSSHLLVDYDADGKIVRHELLSYLPPDMRGAGGAVQVRYLRDAAGRDVDTEYLDDRGQLASGPNGVARERVTFDEYGNAIRAEGLDVNGQRVKKMVSKTLEIHSGLVEIKYDSLGRATEWLVLNDNNEPIVSEKVPFKITYKYGRTEKPVEFTQHFNLPPGTVRTEVGSPPVRGTAVLRPDGSAREMIAVREVAGSADQNDLVLSVARANAAGQVIEMSYEDQHGQLAIGPDGTARQTFEFDRFGKISSLRVYGLNGLMVYPKISAAGMDTLRDERGNEIEVKLIGTDGKLIENAEGVAMTKRKWDDKSRMLVEAYYNREAKLMRRAGVFAWLAIEYNDDQGTEEWRFHDERGQPCTNADGIYRRRLKKTAGGREVEERFFDAKGAPMFSSQQVYGARSQMDARGKLRELILLDDQGRPFVGQPGYAKKTIQRDRQGNITVEQYLDENDQPIPLTAVGGHHRIEFNYDASGRLLQKCYVFATDTKPEGIHGVARQIQQFDASGNEIEQRHLDNSGQLTMSQQGYAVLHKVYDGRNRLVEDWSEDTAGQPCDMSSGYCRIKRLYAGEQLVEIQYLNSDGRPAIGPEGFATVKRQESDDGSPQWLVLGTDGAPTKCLVEVEKVLPNSVAERIGLKASDVLIAYNRIPVVHLLQFIELTGLGSEPVREILLQRNGQVITLKAPKGKLGALLRVVPEAARQTSS